jgi:AcrR family transcriptional regulator
MDPMDVLPQDAQHERERVLAAARALFGEHGFSLPDAAIAAGAGLDASRIGALFPDRAALVEAVIAPLFDGRWQQSWSDLLADRSLPLAQRLSRFYIEYRGRVDRTEARLWTWAGLNGAHASGRASGTLAGKLFSPMISEMRHESLLPGFERRPLLPLERELAQSLHGAIAFINTRRFVFGSNIEPSLETLVPMIVRSFLPGAKQELIRIHREATDAAAGGRR